MLLPRRCFLQLSTAAALAPSPLFQQSRSDDVPLVDQVPPKLDHILLGCNDLQRGIDFVQQQTGVRAAFGGVHPGRGTQNALLSLGELHYLEIMAPDPKQPHVEQQYAVAQVEHLKQLASPALIGWAARSGDIEAFAAKLKSAGVQYLGPWPGSRQRPDGKTLQWKTLNLQDDSNGLLPFYIEWSSDSSHPSTDAPSGCQLLRFELATPDPSALSKLAGRLAIKVTIAQADKPQLHATIRGPKGTLSLTS